MPSLIKTVTFDCADAPVAARFWAAALGSDVDEDSSAAKAHVEAAGWGGPNMWFIRVPESKAAKNRMHFDLRAPDDLAAEVERLVRLGASAFWTLMPSPRRSAPPWSCAPAGQEDPAESAVYRAGRLAQ